ncbi:protein timeless-like isoform X2 [Penaeus japonicus]|nr:protein timeless-like isoform X2 [Penaeus japonicus]XP_042876539.1 protein timeless-like isoform X2 [Penaeus japonicus]XP_042876540.1 protein timeless-like isoform X2 [Penaeus japonicus]XP_042876541.1 protein timeless-like isoform X2 [Penaeus japonicus]XP_042876542.1 protein timeless-like isoform X2 [Penaeus japonicus]XP_042876543.1 protein timeless-like isoform X2 [Penaeus japonicus]
MPVNRRYKTKKTVCAVQGSSDSTMEWMMMNMDRFFAPTIQLGGYVGEDKYVVAPNCRAKVEEILHRLNQDKARWHFRRSLFMNKIISKNLLPTLIHVKDDRGVMEAIIKVLQELMTPVECLMPVEIMGRNYEGRHIVHELESAIVMTKKLFLDTRVTKALIDLMSSVLQDSKVLSLAECELINHCLLLVRNLLHVSNIPCPLINKAMYNPPTSSSSSNQQAGASPEVLTEDQIMWNLFAHRFDNILIQLLTCDQQHLWNVTLVQLVSLMYREQQQSTIRKLIHEWLESSLSESSEDDENNTMSSSSSDAISTSDPVSDSSERLSPVDSVNKGENTNVNENNENSDTSRIAKTDKEDSCKDSGFGRSGSNMDSSPEESVSEGTSQRMQKIWNSTSTNDDSQQYSTDHTSSLNNLDQVQNENVKHRENKMDQMETSPLGLDNMKDELSERESDQGGSGGSEGGSEGSSPVPAMGQESPISQIDIDSRDPNLPQYIHNVDEEILTAVGSLLMEDGGCDPTPLRVETIDNVAQMEEEVNQQMCSPQESIKRPPNKEESGSSGDSSEKKPPPQLPKLLKNKPLTGQKRSRHTMSQKMLSESQENNESSNSTGSECDEGPHAKRPHHQKPHKMLSKPRPAKMLQKALQERNIKRSKLMKRKESNSIKAKALLHHHPTADDISNLLKEFTVDFMLNGYSNMVQGLRLQVMLPYQIDLDKSHVLWLITYFLRFAVELDLELSQICPVLSVDVVSYLVYEGVVMQEELEQAVRSGEDNLLPHVRRLHLVVTALREFFVALDVCLKKEQNLCNAGNLLQIKEELGQLVEVRQLFVLLIRMYRPGVLNLNYLQDLITTNHRFLTTQEGNNPTSASSQCFNIVNHIKQFATMDMMRQYGRLLENFNINDETVNDCIFTMMHHIAGDLRNVNVLLQPPILRVFLRIWKEGFELCADWADLIEYVLRKCTRVRTEHPNKEKKDTQKPVSEPLGIELTDEDLDQLYSLYTASTSEQDLMDKIKEICCDDSIEEPIKKEVIQKLLARGFITTSECSKLCAEIPPIEPLVSKSEGALSVECDVMQVSSDSEESMDAPHPAPLKSINKKYSEKNISAVHEMMPLLGPLKSKKLVPPEVDNAKNLEEKIIPLHKETSDSVQGASSDKTEESAESNMTCTEDSTDWDDNTTITMLIGQLKEEGYGAQVQWLQLQLLEACYSKLKMVGPNLPKAEPVPCHFTLSNQSIPLVPWTSEQEEAFSSLKFRQLLGELGFHLPSDTGKIFPRIPHFWCPDVLFMVAKRLGPINGSSLRVSVEWMQDMMQQMRAMTLTGALGTLGTQGDEDTTVLKDSSLLDCDDSSERVSDCSMENNRSSPTSPASSIDEKLALLHDEETESSEFSQRIPMAGLMVSPAGVPAGHESLEDHDGVISSPARPISTADDVMMMLSDTEEAPASVEVPLFLCSENQEVKMDT